VNLKNHSVECTFKELTGSEGGYAGNQLLQGELTYVFIKIGARGCGKGEQRRDMKNSIVG
jgi:hypothetical protein